MPFKIYTYEDPYKLDQADFWEEISVLPHFCGARTLVNGLKDVLGDNIQGLICALDDFVISYFVGPTNFQTLPLLIYSMTKKQVKPDMYALSTLIIVTVFVLLIVSNVRSGKRARKEGGKA